jgi:hypothetical protein
MAGSRGTTAAWRMARARGTAPTRRITRPGRRVVSRRGTAAARWLARPW